MIRKLLGLLVLCAAGVFLVRSDWFWSVARPAFYKDIIDRQAVQHRLDPLLIVSIIQAESHFAQTARSPVGAVGLMQIMPQTAIDCARSLKIREFRLNDLYVPEVNIRIGVFHLARLRQEFRGNETLMLAAWNAGREPVKKWVGEHAARHGGQAGPLRIEDIPFAETRGFVASVNSTYKRLKTMQSARRALARAIPFHG